uniref:Fibronectin type-III domain-containing protein n=1 Tax=Globisporangium ultimum (strain ATCC 200006 / CBS 805.95 / DAOM BR144) TaxID=431595 RepID=K3X2B4_GLOUD
MVAPIITEVSESFVCMRLQLPQGNGSEITRVSIQSQCTGAVASVTTASFRRLLKPQDQDDTWESIMSDVGLLRNCDADDSHDTNLQANLAVSLDKEFIAMGLAPGCVYYFRAKAFNQSGWSPDGEVSDGICTNDSPKVVHKSARSITLVWAKPYSTEHIDAYELHARVSTSTQWTTLGTNLLGQSLVLQDQLIPSTAYSFRIVPHFALRGGRWGDANKCTCSPLITMDAAPPEPPVDLQVLDRTAQSVTLAWGMPRCNGHVVKSYRLQYRFLAADSSGMRGENQFLVAS